MDIHMHFGRGIEETKLVIAAFAPDWLGHPVPQTKIQVAAQELVLEMAPQWQAGPSQLMTRRNSENLQQRRLFLLDVVTAFLV